MSSATFGTQACLAWIRESDRLIERSGDHLGQLDRAIGDGDHGANLARGFAEAVAQLREKNADTPDAVLRIVGRGLISKTGGASGPLYGTAFRRAARALAEAGDGDAVEAVSPARLGEALRAASDAVQELGSAAEGDKTMVDALVPAVAEYDRTVSAGGKLADATRDAAEAAEVAAEATEPMLARRGRASYLGERSIGHRDPGAASTALIFRALASVTADDKPADE